MGIDKGDVMSRRRAILMALLEKEAQYTILSEDLKNSSNWVNNKSWTASSPTAVYDYTGRCCYPIALSCNPTKSYMLKVIGTGSSFMYVRCLDADMNILSTVYNNGAIIPIGTYYVVVFYVKTIDVLLANYSNQNPYFTEV